MYDVSTGVDSFSEDAVGVDETNGIFYTSADDINEAADAGGIDNTNGIRNDVSTGGNSFANTVCATTNAMDIPFAVDATRGVNSLTNAVGTAKVVDISDVLYVSPGANSSDIPCAQLLFNFVLFYVASHDDVSVP